MKTVQIELGFDEKKGEIILSFDDGEPITIDTNGDIDLTGYVKTLTYLIETGKKLVLKKFESDDPKLGLIQETIANITDSYNESIESESDADSSSQEKF